MIQLIGVGKRYGRGPLVISGVDVEIPAGHPLVVLGDTGSGKSILLRLIAGCIAPTHGRVIGRPATVGYVPDRFPARLRMPADAYRRHLRRIRPRHAQALCSGAPLLVLDEPWSGLDADARPVLTAAVEQAVATGAAVTDHMRTAETQTGRRTTLLHHNGLTEGSTEPRTVAITLRCTDPDQVAQQLPGRGTVERQPSGLALRVHARDVDALLLTALCLGCSGREVRECVR